MDLHGIQDRMFQETVSVAMPMRACLKYSTVQYAPSRRGLEPIQILVTCSLTLWVLALARLKPKG